MNAAAAGRRFELRHVGLGELIQRITRWFGVRPCAACHRRARRLNEMFTVPVPSRTSSRPASSKSGGGPPRAVAAAFSPCWQFAGRCTGFGRRQCVTAPESQNPDANTFEQCCNGWFQYPWVEVCPNEPPRSGCGFCLW
jgi:hypothetical protein